MDTSNLSAMREWIRASSGAQLLFHEDALVEISARAQALLPGIKCGDSAERIFDRSYPEFSEFSGQGSLVFSSETANGRLDMKVTKWMDYEMVELLEDNASLSAAALRSIAGAILKPMTTIMSLTPKLLPLLSETESNLQRTAMVNKSLYSLMRTAKNLQKASEPMQKQGNNLRLNLTVWSRKFARELTPLCESAKRNFRLEVPEKSHMCSIDKEPLERAVLNLISNAIKYTDEGGEIVLSLKKLPSGRMRLTVRDNGCGIAPDRIGRVFSERSALLPDPRDGVGLGLSTARSIVSAYGGSLYLESQVGVGTAVHISLRCMDRPDELNLRSEIQVPSYTGGYNPMLLELADALPYEVFDPRGIDL